MSHIDFKIAVLKSGLKQSDIAKEYGCSRQWVNQLLNGKVQCIKFNEWFINRFGLSI